MKRILIVAEVGAFLVLAASALVLSGCSSRKVEYRIGVVPKGLTHEFWQSIHRGAERAAADLEREEGIVVDIVWDGPSKESDAQEQIKIIRQMRNQGINGLVLAPQDSKAMVPAVQECVEKKVPVVVIDSGLDASVLLDHPDFRTKEVATTNKDGQAIEVVHKNETPLIVKYVATNNYHGGEVAAEELVKLLEKDGKTEPRVILFRYQVGSESTDQREQGFLDRIEKFNAAGKKIQVISKDKYAGATVETAEKTADPLVRAHRDDGIDGIFAVNESAATGMLNALRSQKLNRKIRLVGFDSSEPLLQAVREGDVDGLIVQDPYRMGYLGVWTLIKYLKGFDVDLDHTQLGTGEVYLTRDNINTDEMKGRYLPEFQAKRTIDRPKYPHK